MKNTSQTTPSTKRPLPPFVHRVPVMFHDVDAAGTAYYPRLIDFCHCAFEALFNERIGPSYASVIGGGMGFPSVHFEIDFMKPVRHGDVIEIGVRVARVGRTSVGLEFEARRGRTVLFRAKNVVVVVDLKTMSARPLTARLRRRFLALQPKP